MDAENPRGDGPAPSAGEGDQSAKKKRLVSLHQMRGMHPRCLICSVKSYKKVPQIMIVPIPRSDDPLAYWRSNHGCFPDLAKMARKYLSAPCTSTDSERLFSAAAHVLDEKRNRLHCDKADKLLFIKKNLPLYLKK
ncbi:zinc finger BED domain-containing protein 1-like [Pimephales promelas]|nr:zinc finger BED domain-containing protein 1-like [Pimephales promelas]